MKKIPFWLWKRLILLGIVFLNFWIWKIIVENINIAIIITILTFLLFQILTGKNFKVLSLTFIIVLFSILSFQILKTGFDKKIQTLKAEDNIKLNERHLYYSQELGNLFLNRKVLNFYRNYSLSLYKYEQNLFSNLDLNLYFFASHPRERADVAEFEKFPMLFLPFFIIGTILLIYWGSNWAFIYLILASSMSAFITSVYPLGPILFFPFVSVSIAIGIIYVLGRIKVLKINTNEK